MRNHHRNHTAPLAQEHCFCPARSVSEERAQSCLRTANESILPQLRQRGLLTCQAIEKSSLECLTGVKNFSSSLNVDFSPCCIFFNLCKHGVEDTLYLIRQPAAVFESGYKMVGWILCCWSWLFSQIEHSSDTHFPPGSPGSRVTLVSSIFTSWLCPLVS